MSWQRYRFFLKFLALVVGGSIIALGLAVVVGDPLNSKADRLAGDPFYDGIVDLISLVGQTWAGVIVTCAGIVITVVFYRSASRR